jgi:phage gpG-like protein
LIVLQVESSGKIFKQNLQVELPLKQITHKVAEENRQNIQQSKSFDGSAIQPNNPIYASRKGNNKVFFYTGQLSNSIVETVFSPTYSEITIQSDRDLIAQYLITGTKNMPARKFFGITQQKLTSIIDEMIKEYGIFK